MADYSKIEWTDATWNPLRGCSRVSEGCRHCYAERVAARFSGPGMAYEGLIHPSTRGWNGNVNIAHDVLDQPLRWKRPRRIFVNSMSDLFHESVSDVTIAGIFGIMAAASQHTFQVLTKRPERMVRWFHWMGWQKPRVVLHESTKGLMGYHHPRRPAINDGSWPLSNVWLGVSVEDQKTADERIPLLMQCPPTVRWLSCEPLLGPVNVRGYLMEGKDPGRCANCGKGHGFTRCPNYGGIAKHRSDFDGGPVMCNEFRRANFAIDWVVAGGESGPHARPMHPDWARSLRDQCSSAGVPFFFKQWGEWAPYDRSSVNGALLATPYSLDMPMQKFGKKLSGRLLDGVEHNGFPEQRA